MKKILLSVFFAVIVFSTAFAQVPASFNYQAVVRNSSGEILANKTVSFRISILKNSKTGAVLYSERHKITTNDFGLVNLKIGEGTKISGDFSPVGWGDVIFTKVEIDPAGGTSYSHLATTKLSSVPYAFKAQTVVNDKVDDADADPANEIQEISISGTTLQLSKGGGTVILPSSGGGSADNWGTQTVVSDESLTGEGTTANPLSVVADGDGDDTNELQTLSKTGNSIQLSNGGGTVTDAVNDADADPTNEIQSLSLSGNELSIDGGNTVTLPWEKTSSEIRYRGNKTVIIGDASGGSSLKTKSAGISTPPKLDISTGAHTGIHVYNETDSYYGINIWNEEGTAAYFGNNSGMPVAVFDNNDTGLAADFRNAIKITDGNQGAGKVLTSDANGVASWQTPASGGSSLWTASGSNVYRSAGKVGIGTSSPVFNIDLQTSNAAIIGAKSNSSNAHFVVDRAAQANSADVLYRTSGENKLYAGLADNTDDYWISFEGFNILKGLKVESDGDVATSKNLSVAGKVGIGTTSPSFAMDIQASAATLRLKATSTNAIVYLDRKSSDDHAYILHRTNGANKFYVGLLGDDDYWVNSGSSATFKGLKVKADGSVATSGNLNVSAKLNANEIFCNSNLEVSDDLTVGDITISAGEIQKTSTGTANMIAYAYGFVSSNGTLRASSGNVSVVRSTFGHYTVTITGETYSDDNYVTILSHQNSLYSIGYTTVSGKINVYITKNSDDTYVDADFSFVIYKM